MKNNTTENRLLFIYAESSLHAGSGRGLGYVDLPIQRERVTDYPMIQSSSLKGRLRADVREKKNWADDSNEVKTIFGATDEAGKSYAGAVTPGDARLLLLPVRSLQGVFAWVTSLNVLHRFLRDIAALDFPALDWELPDEPGQNACWAGAGVTFENKVTLEEFTYTAKEDGQQVIQKIGSWLAKNALPQDNDEYQYWRQNLPQHLVILPDDDFRDFARYGTEVQTHIRIEPDTKTVQGGALWTVESLPSDTLLYAPLIVNNSRAQVENQQTATEIVNVLQDTLHDKRTHLGGNETTGQGVVMLHLCNPSEVKNG